MSKGSRRKRETRPWQHAGAMRDIADIGGQLDVDADLQLDGYVVRRVDPSRALKDYVCPECGNTVEQGEGHVVVWPEHDSDLRRHWHKHCWRFEVRRTDVR